MKNTLIVICLMVFLACAVSVDAAQDSKDEGKVSEKAAAVTNNSQPAFPVSAGQQGFSTPGLVMAPLVEETAKILKEMVDVLKSSNSAKQSADLIKKAEELISRSNSAIESFRQVTGFGPVPNQVQTNNK